MKTFSTHKRGGQQTIRPGQYKPYVKATRRQIDERIGYVARLLRVGRTKTQIHRAVRARFNVEWRQCDRYIALLTRHQSNGDNDENRETA